MTPEEKKDLVRRFYESFASPEGDAHVAEFIAPDYAVVQARRRRVVGIEGARAHRTAVRATYSDLQLEIGQQIAEGDWIVTRVIMRGRHRGVFLGMRPTGRTIEVEGVNIDRVEGGRIVEHAGAANTLEAFMASGLLTPVDPVEPGDPADRVGHGKELAPDDPPFPVLIGDPERPVTPEVVAALQDDDEAGSRHPAGRRFRADPSVSNGSG